MFRSQWARRAVLLIDDDLDIAVHARSQHQHGASARLVHMILSDHSDEAVARLRHDDTFTDERPSHQIVEQRRRRGDAHAYRFIHRRNLSQMVLEARPRNR